MLSSQTHATDEVVDRGLIKRPRETVIRMPSAKRSTVEKGVKIVPVPSQPPVEAVRDRTAELKREKALAGITKKRWIRAMRSGDCVMLTRCIENGHIPTLHDWVNIISKMHVQTALKCVSLVRSLECICLQVAIRRQHKMLFKEVLERVPSVPPKMIDALMLVPAYYLDVCLDKGLDPNTPLKSKRLPLEESCGRSRIQHITTLLNDERVKVSTNVCRYVIRKPKQQKFAVRCIELCENIPPDMILEAVVANLTPALQSIVQALETRYPDSKTWDTIYNMMLCPILNDVTADLVKIPAVDHYYDRASLMTWVNQKHTNPLTREPLEEHQILQRSEFLKDYALIMQKLIKTL